MRISRWLISRRTVLALYGASVALACLWVPWKISMRYIRPDWPATVYFAGYSSLWSPPAPWKIRENVPALSGYDDKAILFGSYFALTWVPSIDGQRIGLEFLALTALAGVAFLLAPFRIPYPGLQEGSRTENPTEPAPPKTNDFRKRREMTE